MADAQKARRAEAYVGINGVNVWGDIKEYVTSVTFTENATGATDSFDIDIIDADERWINSWLVDHGTLIDAKINLKGWQSDAVSGDFWLDCGSFLVDTVKVKGYPIQVTIQSLALPLNGTKNTKKWEDISISAIAEDICGYLGCELKYYADDLTIDSRQQSRQKDIEFLYSLCSEYGLGMKVYRNSIVIFNREDNDAADNVGTLDLRRDADTFTLTDTEEGAYTGAQCNYKPDGSDDEITYTYGGGNNIIVLDSTAKTEKEAELKARAALYEANTERITLKFTTAGNGTGNIYPGTNYWIEGLGAYSGKYAIDKAVHTISGKARYSVSVTAHKVE